MAKSSVTNEALQVFREGKALLRESRTHKNRLEATLLDVFNTKSRQEALRYSPINVGRLKELHGITTFDNDVLNDIRAFVEKSESDVVSRFNLKVATERPSCRKATYYRARHIVGEVEKAKLTLYHLLHLYNTSLQSIIAGRRGDIGGTSKGTTSASANDWIYMLECLDEFNQLMKEDASLMNNLGVTGTDGGPDYVNSAAATAQSTIESGIDDGSSTTIFILQCVRQRWSLLHGNHHPTYIQKLGRQTSSSQILRLLAIERCWLSSFELAKTVVIGYNRRTLENAAGEAAWLTIPQSITPSFTSLSGLLPGLSKMSRKNKDGNGNKRKNRSKSGTPSAEASPGGSSGLTPDRLNETGPGVAIPAEHALQRVSGVNSNVSHLELVEDFVRNEELFLSDLFSVLSKVC